ncbi:MAG: DUF1294 domain-containing protein [Bacteroidales bacterium]
MKWLFFYFVAMNIVAFYLYGVDKRRSRKRYWRINEKKLIFVAIIGGSIGSLLGMQLFNHKIKHIKFRFGIPLIIVVQMIVVFLLVN